MNKNEGVLHIYRSGLPPVTALFTRRERIFTDSLNTKKKRVENMLPTAPDPFVPDV